MASSSEFYLQPTPEVRVSLSTDVVLPTPWDRERYVGALATIGEGKVSGPWTSDTNHAISVWMPWKIAFVTGGNHSIATGILLGEGELLADEVFDMTPIFERVTCDGNEYRSVQTGEPIVKVIDHRRAAVFEIGRLIVDAARM